MIRDHLGIQIPIYVTFKMMIIMMAVPTRPIFLKTNLVDTLNLKR